MRYARGVPSGLARWLTGALIVLGACDPLSFSERAQRAIGDGGVAIDDAVIVVDDVAPPADSPIEGGPPDVLADAPMEGGPDAVVDAGLPDAATPVVPDASLPDAGVPDAGPPGDGGPGDGSLTDALGPDARQPPGLPVAGSNDDQIHSFYACSTGDGASALPLLVAILALRRRRR